MAHQGKKDCLKRAGGLRLDCADRINRFDVWMGFTKNETPFY